MTVGGIKLEIVKVRGRRCQYCKTSIHGLCVRDRRNFEPMGTTTFHTHLKCEIEYNKTKKSESYLIARIYKKEYKKLIKKHKELFLMEEL